MGSERRRRRAGTVSPKAQSMLALSGLAVGALLSLMGQWVGGVVLIVVGGITLILATVRWRQNRQVTAPAIGDNQAPPIASQLYLALAGGMCFAGAAYMFYQGSRYMAEDNPIGIVAFVTGLLAAVLGAYVLVGLAISSRTKAGKSSRLVARLYPRLASRRRPPGA